MQWRNLLSATSGISRLPAVARNDESLCSKRRVRATGRATQFPWRNQPHSSTRLRRHSDRHEVEWRNLLSATSGIAGLPAVAQDDESHRTEHHLQAASAATRMHGRCGPERDRLQACTITGHPLPYHPHSEGNLGLLRMPNQRCPLMPVLQASICFLAYLSPVGPPGHGPLRRIVQGPVVDV